MRIVKQKRHFDRGIQSEMIENSEKILVCDYF